MPAKNLVEFFPVTMEDITVLSTFPGFIKNNGRYYCANKTPVVRNLIKRLRIRKPSLTIEVPEELTEVKKLLEIPEKFKFHTKPLDLQIIALKFLYTNQGGGLLMDPGLGKTKVALDFILLSKFGKVVVICPKPLCFVWEEQIQQHRPELTYYTFQSTDWGEELMNAAGKNVWIINYRKAAILHSYLMKENFEAMFIDEGLVKDPTSDQTQAITNISKTVPIKVIMSGTLVNNSEIDVFAPVRILEPTLVGSSFATFRDAYMETWQPYKNDPIKKHIKIMAGAKYPGLCKDILNTCSIVMRKETWLKNLPDKTFHYLEVPIPKETKDRYFEFLQNYVTCLDGEFIEADNPLSASVKLSQFGSGFVYYEDVGSYDLFLGAPKKPPRALQRHTYFFKEQPKIDKLRELLEGVLKTKKFILWYTMDAERVLIEQLLKELKIKFITVAGGEKDIGGKVGQFNKTSVQVLLAQARTLNYGVTTLGDQEDSLEFQYIESSIYTQVFYSVTFSLEVFLQQQDRIHRIGQQHACSYYILVADLPTDQRIIEALYNKTDLRNSMLEDIINQCREEILV